jgi:hypothetical protein
MDDLKWELVKVMLIGVGIGILISYCMFKFYFSEILKDMKAIIASRKK